MQDLRIRLLGDLRVEGLDAAALGSRKARTLVAALALGRSRPVGVDVLVDILWPEGAPADPAHQVAVLVSRLRRVLGAGRLARSGAGYTLACDWVDVVALGDLADEAERRFQAGAFAAARTAAGAALAMVRGPFLAGEADAEWAAAERAAASRAIGRAQRVGASAALAAGEPLVAAELAEQALARDGYDEAALRTLMAALGASGRPASALAAYARFAERLAEDLGTDPGAETSDLHAALLRGTPFDAPQFAGAPAGPTASALPGRAPELAVLDAALARAAGGQARVVVVDGEAGMGKTRLLRTWAALAQAGGAHLAFVTCDELGRTLPLQPVLEAIDLLTAGGRDAPEAAGLGLLLPLLGRSGTGEAATLAALTDPGAGQALLLGALRTAVREVAATAPAVIVLDDAHAADAATLAWVAQVERALADAAVLVVLGVRSGEGFRLDAGTVLRLGPLDRAAVAAIVGAERADAVFGRSAGNPLFAVELAAAPDTGEVPASITEAVSRRCDRLGPAARTLRAAAVLGPEVDLDVLVSVTGGSPVELLDHLEEGVRRGLLEDRGGVFAFRHALIRDALHAAVSPAARSLIHREASRALVSRRLVPPLVLAHHARLGGEAVEASMALVAAATAALDRFDAEAAIAMLDTAISLSDGAAPRVLRARARAVLGRYTDAEEDLAAARTLGAREEADEVEAWVAHFQRQFDRALARADDGAHHGTDPALRSVCLGLGGWVSLARGDLAGAELRLAEAVTEAPDPGLPAVWLGWLRLNQGRPEDTVALTRSALAVSTASLGFPNAYAGMSAAMALAMLGRPDEALRTLDALDADIERMGAWRWAPRARNVRAWVLRSLGEGERADELNAEAIETSQGVAMLESHTHGVLDLADGRLQAGDLAAAHELLDRGVQLAAGEFSFSWRLRLRARLLRARLAMAAGDPHAAAEEAGGLAGDASAQGAVRYEVQAALVAAAAARRAGREVDPQVAAAALQRLPRLAGLEAWRLTAEVADAFGSPGWRGLAARQAEALLARAGPHADRLRSAVAARLG
ncbi:MAG TPA: BTAD domain-containing putative transcriptional regulator [Actinomycetota bacterium]|nr:BTAD domain-containing putative transcriptional regulator [Actinomycetota bacterium]